MESKLKPRSCREFLDDGWRFTWCSFSRYVGAEHPRGGKKSIAEVMHQDSFSVDHNEIGYAIAEMLNSGRSTEMFGNEPVFCRRKSDGKFYRGATFWRWCKSWRNAAVLPRAYWNQWLVGVKFGDEIEFVDIGEICKRYESRSP